ncbi:hypothetical protein HYY72_00430 [Candidatus Woesearchaeota archaeon]|nr:hypothetical protein [Candidatus Woesearchaeota archaeon]
MKLTYSAFIVLGAIILAGCAPKTPTQTTFCAGTDGIEMNFVEGSPPSEVFDNNNYKFPVELNLVNKGEYTVQPNEAKIELSGISSIDFGGPSYSKFNREQVSGKHKEDTGICSSGGSTIVTFGESGEEQFAYKNAVPGPLQFKVRADLCYKYKTNAVVQFCVQKELPRFGQEPICKVNEAKQASNSGSPIQIENFNQKPGERKIQFFFDVVHKGKGSIHTGDLCNPDADTFNKNKVRVKVRTQAGPITCSTLGGAEGIVTMVDNKRTVNCVLDTTAITDKTSETPMFIDLEFNYKIHQDAPITVKHLG